MPKNRKPNHLFDFGKTVPFSIDPFTSEIRPQRDLYREEYGQDYNSYGYRCDEFIKDHVGRHVLFSGCSVTFGDGLGQDKMWAHKTYKEMSVQEKTSGYFNLAVSGSSISFIIMKLFKYFKKFGNPDILFLNLPPAERFLSVEGDQVVSSMIYRTVKVDQKSLLLSSAIHFELYSILEAYCKSQKIRLISFTWQGPYHGNLEPMSTLQILKNFDTFYDIHKMFGYVEKFTEQSALLKNANNEDPVAMFARDGDHPGTFDNNFYKSSAISLLDESFEL